ncbi:hypothetical protein COT65_00460 [Candidatus Shapirobacteria bacterium CG09_land_8_20_14_0_10_47_13]|uniref:Large ribosomal subunit protein uL1 n=1 Tax=Candidatus Shapirobacteria bacterium CG09_land_8_20_14_0_10_47_13 TaxID=1974481 RepID=A0A2H0WNC6_9BACT|nr:MAG: hypothetical protein COT65_00460 [Candidatus Shapirobacteria bacterium CG09_land_8_20_14_0_10_47_13]
MGKKRVALVTEEPKIVKSGKAHGRIADAGAEALAEAEIVKQKEAEVLTAPKTTQKKAKTSRPARKRGKRYTDAYKRVVRTQTYQLPDAIKLLKSISITHFNASVDAHLVVLEAGLRGEIIFPHPTGKTAQIRIADDKLIAELEKNKIDFSVLLSTPAMMPKLLKFAKILGPKGLMPNPKTGTITDKPEEAAKKLADVTLFRTEAKFPLIHIAIGKVNDKEEDLAANFKALIEAVGKKNVQKIVLAPSMGPGIKVGVDKL